MDNTHWKRIVIKCGSALIAPKQNGCSSHYLLSIAHFILRCRERGIDVVLVSSGSVAAGRHLFADQDKSIAAKKAMAAAGQTEMMATWDKLFDFATAQILLTHADLRDRERYESIRNTIDSLVDNGILPIVNENDTVTTDKLKVGDNDNLSAMVAAAFDADALIICSDVDGLYDKNPHKYDDAKLLSWISEIDESTYKMAGDAVSDVGTGGMKTKIQAAEKATSHGIDTFIVNGFTELSFNQLLAGKNPGTHFQPHAKPLSDHQHWMTHTAKAQGELIVNAEFDAPAEKASEGLTGATLKEVKGQFNVGDTVLIKKEDGTKIAKARSNYSSCLLSFIAEQDNPDYADEFQKNTGPILSDKNIAILENS